MSVSSLAPVVLIRTPSSRIVLTTSSAKVRRLAAGASPRPMSTPKNKPAFRIPRTSLRALGELLQPRLQALAHGQRVLGNPIPLQNCQNRVGGRYSDGVAGKRVRVPGGGAEAIHRRLAADNSTDWKAIAHRLAEGDEVRRDAVPLETPHARACPSKARLNFVGNDESACLPHRGHSAGDEAGRIDPHAVARKDAVDEKRRDADPAPVQIRDRAPHLRFEELRRLRFRYTRRPGKVTMRTEGLSLTASPRLGDTIAVAALVP